MPRKLQKSLTRIGRNCKLISKQPGQFTRRTPPPGLDRPQRRHGAVYLLGERFLREITAPPQRTYPLTKVLF
jgi:hypothetical protein